MIHKQKRTELPKISVILQRDTLEALHKRQAYLHGIGLHASLTSVAEQAIRSGLGNLPATEK